ncbi:hypothetical protein [Agrobacterium tumefaciens]|uniref:hypothetical protein n=1 Tax=Agrobacterium tumefaciens TaxID=358 RepID=UPI0015735401|nr:hypothetical protein [Agrobacterium tumefaciens]
MRTIEAVRKDLKERIAQPSKFDTPPPFMKDIAESEITEADTALWLAAERAWLDHQTAEDRRWTARLERKSAWLGGVVVALALFAWWRSRG